MSDSFTNFPGAPGAFPAAGSFPPPAAPMGGGFGPAAGGFPGSGFGSPMDGPAARPQPGPVPAAAPAGKAPKGKRAKKQRTPKADKPVTRRLISRQVVIAAVFAIVAGGSAVYLLRGQGTEAFVVRTNASVAAGTNVSGGLLEAFPLPVDAIEPGAIQAPTAAQALSAATKKLGDKTVAQYPLAAHAQLHVDQFGLQATLGAELQPTERLVSIQAGIATSVAGGLVVGDRVDIIGTTDGRTHVVAYNIPIVAITVSADQYNSVADQQAADKNVKAGDLLPGAPVPGIYTVKVGADTVPSLLNWNQSATLNLVYRGTGALDVVTDDNYLEVPATS